MITNKQWSIMKVKELVEELSKLDQDSLVLVSSDEEGNSIRPLEYVGEEQGFEEDRNEWFCLHPDDFDDYPDRKIVVLLSP